MPSDRDEDEPQPGADQLVAMTARPSTVSLWLDWHGGQATPVAKLILKELSRRDGGACIYKDLTLPGGC